MVDILESFSIRNDRGVGAAFPARMAKSADAADLKSAGRKAVGVQVPLRAPNKNESDTRQLTVVDSGLAASLTVVDKISSSVPVLVNGTLT